jgi:hypothetical protein
MGLNSNFGGFEDALNKKRCRCFMGERSGKINRTILVCLTHAPFIIYSGKRRKVMRGEYKIRG